MLPLLHVENTLRCHAGESPAATPVHAGTRPSVSRGDSSQDKGMEAGDEEIDWDHTRMLSLGFFPSISTDQVCGCFFCVYAACVCVCVLVRSYCVAVMYFVLRT